MTQSSSGGPLKPPAPPLRTQPTNAFGATLRELREQTDLSQSALGRRAEVHASIVSRLESGDRTPSGPGLVEALARGLQLSPDDTDRLLAAAGFVPAVITRLGAGDPTLLLVAQVLTDSRVSEDERQRLRDVVEAAVRWCRAASR